ncbi:MAG: GNAT family N-acetyltransferase [Planctomycetota bacterium]|jgi:GNAT superfamily N-acetyltransferase
MKKETYRRSYSDKNHGESQMKKETYRSRPGAIDIVALANEHLEEAALAVVARCGAAREREPLLPLRHEDPKTVLPRLRSRLLPDWRGTRSAWVPEWAHAVVGKDRWRVYRLMYSALSGQWVADGRITHLMTFLADDDEAVDAFVWSEFGMIGVDAVRDVTNVDGTAQTVDIRRVLPEDADTLVTLSAELISHLSAAPVFMYPEGIVEREAIEKLIADPRVAFWLAFRGGEAAGFMRAELGNASADLLKADDTAGIKGAFTRESRRGCGIGSALLSRALEWAREKGCGRCAVDFEPQNIPGRRFWMRHFKPVCYSMVRHVDARRAGPPVGPGASHDG